MALIARFAMFCGGFFSVLGHRSNCAGFVFRFDVQVPPGQACPVVSGFPLVRPWQQRDGSGGRWHRWPGRPSLVVSTAHPLVPAPEEFRTGGAAAQIQLEWDWRAVP